MLRKVLLLGISGICLLGCSTEPPEPGPEPATLSGFYAGDQRIDTKSPRFVIQQDYVKLDHESLSYWECRKGITPPGEPARQTISLKKGTYQIQGDSIHIRFTQIGDIEIGHQKAVLLDTLSIAFQPATDSFSARFRRNGDTLELYPLDGAEFHLFTLVDVPIRFE